MYNSGTNLEINTLRMNTYVFFVLSGVLASLSGTLCTQEMGTLCVHLVDFEVVNVKYEISWVDMQRLQIILGVQEKVEKYFYSFSSSTLERSDVLPEKLLVYRNSSSKYGEIKDNISLGDIIFI